LRTGVGRLRRKRRRPIRPMAKRRMWRPALCRDPRRRHPAPAAGPHLGCRAWPGRRA